MDEPRGFTHFISVWLYRAERSYLIDVGPARTVPRLLEHLANLGVEQLDAILLTHIHLDHAGGIGEMARRFPETPIYCHQSAIRHLQDPTRLWEGSLKTLGETARAYGPIAAVSSGQLIDAEETPRDQILPIMTPGHAPHHVSYRIAPHLFLGETGGVLRSLEDDRIYLRPATPPRLFLDTAIESLDKLIALNPHTICYGHFGLRHDGVEMLQRHRRQLKLWESILEENMAILLTEEGPDGCLETLLERDPEMAEFSHLPAAEQERERFFLMNSIKGYRGYLQEREG